MAHRQRITLTTYMFRWLDTGLRLAGTRSGTKPRYRGKLTRMSAATVPMRGIKTVDLTAVAGKARDMLPPANGADLGHATIIGIDPGGTTGWTLITVAPESLIDADTPILDTISDHRHGQVDCGMRRGNLSDTLHPGISTHGEFAGVNELLWLCSENPYAAVVVESFTLNQFRRDQELLSPVRITSAIGYSLWKDNRDYFTQSPADAKNVCTDDALKKWKVYDRHGSMVHARDADRHAILFLRRAKQRKDLRARAWPHLFGPSGAFTDR